eukprot:7769817-Alexandrium_andersonii.AAC.1
MLGSLGLLCVQPFGPNRFKLHGVRLGRPGPTVRPWGSTESRGSTKLPPLTRLIHGSSSSRV